MNDEDQIRALVASWLSATTKGDVEAVLRLMTDDVVFLVPGRPPMRKAEYASAATAQAQEAAPHFDGKSEIQEVKVSGDWAFMWSRLTVVASPPGGGQTTTRSGHTLSVFQKQGGKWLLARDANLLAPTPNEAK
jgi:uncharacterized protein (TIGR02246 family)